MATDTWGVDTYHVNVGNGDCSFHVLAYLALKDRRVAWRCVLIDGGSAMMKVDPGPNTHQPHPVRQMIGFLTQNYEWPNSSNKRCQLDTIVISHWDEDHYGALLAMIKDDAAINKGVIDYLKYTDDGTTLRPATYFYVPNWAWGWQSPKLNGAPGKYMNCDAAGYGSINIFYEGYKTTVLEHYVPFCMLRTADPNLQGMSLGLVLGREFFFNKKCSVNVDQVPDLAALVKSNPPQDPKIQPNDPLPPSMYCIAVMQRQLGPSAVGVIPDAKVTRTNRVSIICIIYWTDTKRISHYLAGDADDPTEVDTINWLIRSGVSKMTTMKLSHHGSRSSTPLGFLNACNPQNIFMSTPSSRHIHPCTFRVMAPVEMCFWY